MKPVENRLIFSDDADISVFMDTHDGFELVDQGMAELEESRSTFTRGKSYVEVDPETFRLLHELVTSGASPDLQHALSDAVHTYIRAIFPQSSQFIHA